MSAILRPHPVHPLPHTSFPSMPPTNTPATEPSRPPPSSSPSSSFDSTSASSPSSTSTPTPGLDHNASPKTPISPFSLPPASVSSPHPHPSSPHTPSFPGSTIPGVYSAQLMTSPGENGKDPHIVDSYVPAGTSGTSSKPGPVPTRQEIPLQTTYPTEVPSGVLSDLASTAGISSERDEESSGLMSALLSEDSTNERLRFEAGEEAVERDTTWPTGGRHKECASQSDPYGDGTSNGFNSRLDNFKGNDSVNGNVKEDALGKENLVAGGKPPLDPKSKTPAKITATHSEPHLPFVPAGAQTHPETKTFQLSNAHIFDLKVGKGASKEEPPIVDGRLLQATQSMPVWMPSTVTMAAAVSDAGELSAVNTLLQTPGATKEESIHSVHSSHATDKHPATDGSVSRTKSMPARDIPDPVLPENLMHSSTEKRRIKKNLDNANVRVVAEAKLSDRKKRKLMKKLATIQRDGAVEFDIGRSARLAKDLFGPGIMDEEESDYGKLEGEQAGEEDEEGDQQTIPPLKIVMLIVGTRGDVQPFIAIGKKLQEYGHRVRLASHANFRDFVKKEGLEFYPLGGDPKVLAGYMVKNKGFLPSGPSEISVQRKEIRSIVFSLLSACTAPDIDSGVLFSPHAIIANPPAYGHVHVAEYLNVPLHIFFTMPWTATSAFPHPLSRVKQSAGNRLSYQVVDSLIWLGIRGIINSFRKKKLNLRPITYLSGSQGSISEKPTGYIWSPHLVPKPRDWGPLVDVVGFCFLNLATNYKPPEDLVKWLEAGPAPIYIGFGSLPVEDPEGMTKIIIEALEKTNQRGIIGKGWGGIGNLSEVPENVYLLSDCPHDWLFPQCAAVVHHGGAGTTAAGLKAACPTTIIPFFGDQPFWGERVHEKGVGPAPIPVNHFSLDKLVLSIEFMLKPEVKKAALELAKGMEKEDGVQGAVNAFHKHIQEYLPDLLFEKALVSHHRSIRRTLVQFKKTVISLIR